MRPSGPRTSTNRGPRKRAAGPRTSCSRNCPMWIRPPPPSRWRAPRRGCAWPSCAAAAGRRLERRTGAASPHRFIRCTGSMAATYDPPVSDDRGELVIRPSWKVLARWDLRLVAFAALALVAGSVRIYSYGAACLLAFLGIASLAWGRGAVYLVAYI